MTTLTSSSQIFANQQSGLGTVGGFFKFNDGTLYGITNNHVIANANKCHIGDPVYLFDDDQTMIGTLVHWVTLDATKVNFLDIALFQVADGINFSWLLPTGTGMPVLLEPPTPNDQVYMVLPDGSKRTGKITNPAIGFNTSFNLCGTDFSFTGLIEIQSNDTKPFAEHGNSGSLIFNSNHNIIGVMLGTNFTLTRGYAVPFKNGTTGIESVYNLSITGSVAMPQDDQA